MEYIYGQHMLLRLVYFQFYIFRSVKQLKKLEKEIQALEQKVAAEKIKTARSSISQTA